MKGRKDKKWAVLVNRTGRQMSSFLLSVPQVIQQIKPKIRPTRPDINDILSWSLSLMVVSCGYQWTEQSQVFRSLEPSRDSLTLGGPKSLDLGHRDWDFLSASPFQGLYNSSNRSLSVVLEHSLCLWHSNLVTYTPSVMFLRVSQGLFPFEHFVLCLSFFGPSGLLPLRSLSPEIFLTSLD